MLAGDPVSNKKDMLCLLIVSIIIGLLLITVFNKAIRFQKVLNTNLPEQLMGLESTNPWEGISSPFENFLVYLN